MDRIAAFLKPSRLRAYGRIFTVAVLSIWIFTQLTGQGRLNAGGDIIGADFVAFYSAAIELGNDTTFDSLYSIENQHARQTEIAALGSRIHAFVSPAFVAVLWIPLTKIEYKVAVLIWQVLMLLLFGFAFSLIQKELSPQPFSVAWYLVFFPVFATFWFGQMTAIYFLAMVIWFLSARKRSWILCGLALGVFALKPQLMLGPTLVLMLSKQWKPLVVGAVVFSIPYLMWFQVNPNLLWEYVERVDEVAAIISAIPLWGRQSLLGVLQGVGLASPWWGLVTLSLGCCVAVAGWFRLAPTYGSRQWHVATAWVLCVSLIASPHLYVYDVALFLVPFALLASNNVLSDERSKLAITLVCIASWVGPWVALFCRVSTGLALQLFIPTLIWCLWVVYRKDAPLLREHPSQV